MSAPASQAAPAESQLACFLLGGDSYAIDIMRIKEIVPFQKVRPVPRSPKFVRGVVNLRGSVLPIVDLRDRFGLPPWSDAESMRRIVITSVGGRIVGLAVDAVSEILKASGGEIVRVPALLSSRETAYVYGLALSGEKIVLILNIDRLLSSSEAIDLEKMRKAAFESAGVKPPSVPAEAPKDSSQGADSKNPEEAPAK
ncbi:MAG: chemotaxis protein CheW [Bdellovibrionota bacterium]